MDITVTVIIPCYNAEKYIDETLESLRYQIFKNFEVICINDGSKDKTLQILERWSRNSDLNIRVISQSNLGVSVARNRGILEAKGRYITFLDADDTYHPKYLYALLGALERTYSDVAYCYLSRSREEIAKSNGRNFEFIEKNQVESMHDLLYRMADVGFYCYLYRKSVLIENNLFFDIHTKHFEDREFNWKYLAYCNKVACINEKLYWYRKNNTSVTRRKMEWHTDSIEAVIRIEEFLKDRQCGYASKIRDELLPRIMWGLAKGYATGQQKECLYRLEREYDLRSFMWKTLKNDSILVSIASLMYLIHPMLFYYCVGMFKY